MTTTIRSKVNLGADIDDPTRDVLMLAGYAVKDQQKITIDFAPTTFDKIPSVVISTFAADAAKYIDTIIGISQSSCDVKSLNIGNSVQIEWIAIGPVERSKSDTGSSSPPKPNSRTRSKGSK